MQAPRGKQLKITGNIVNVSAHVVSTVSMLPRLPNETSTIKVNLKRRLQYKSSALSQNIRPQKVAEAAKWLINNGDLHKAEGISFNDTWLEGTSSIVFNGSDNEECPEGLSTAGNSNMETVNCTISTEFNNIQHISDDEDHWSEDEAEMPAGVTDSMLTTPDFMTDNERQYNLNVAPD